MHRRIVKPFLKALASHYRQPLTDCEMIARWEDTWKA